MASYPLELYLAGLRYAHPREIAPLIDRVENRLGTPAALEGFFYTTTPRISLQDRWNPRIPS